MSYNILFPIQQQLTTDNLNYHLKHLVKTHYNMNINKILIEDLKRRLIYESKVRYYTEKGLNKMSLVTYPVKKTYANNFLNQLKLQNRPIPLLSPIMSPRIIGPGLYRPTPLLRKIPVQIFD